MNETLRNLRGEVIVLITLTIFVNWDNMIYVPVTSVL